MSEHSENGQLPLDYASECISGIKELILYAACAEQLIQPVCFRITNNAKCILNDFKLAQTEMGSFVINIDIQVADEAEQYTIDGVEGENGRGHLVVQRIGQAIKQIDEMTKNRSAFKELVSNAYESGATANICEALMRLKPDSSSAEIETTIRYASACGKKTADVVKMGSGHFNTMGEISKHYREKESQILAEVEGYITSLVKKKVDEIHAERVIRTIVGINGEMRTVIAELCEEDYRMACDAHRDGEKIYIRGILDMSKKMYRFINVDQFKIILA